MLGKRLAVALMLSADVVGGATYLALSPVEAQASTQFMPCPNTACDSPEAWSCGYEEFGSCGIDEIAPGVFTCTDTWCP